MIQYGGWNGLYGETDEEHNKLGKIAIHVPPGYEDYFGLSPTKNQLYLPLDFLTRVKKELEKPRQWGQIKKSANVGYREAFKHRYDNDGKAAKKKPPAGKKAGKNEKTSSNELFDPSIKPRKKETKPKQGVVRSIKKEGKNTIVSIDNSRRSLKNHQIYQKVARLITIDLETRRAAIRAKARGPEEFEHFLASRCRDGRGTASVGNSGVAFRVDEPVFVTATTKSSSKQIHQRRRLVKRQIGKRTETGF